MDRISGENCIPEQFSEVEKVDFVTPVNLPVENLIKEFELVEKKDIAKQRRQAFGVLLILYTTGVITTFVIIFFQGFKVGGFLLDNTFMSWLGAAVIGELAGLLAIALSFLFKNKE